MIYLGNVWNADPNGFDEVWVICRSVGELDELFKTYKNVIHVPGLAPSEKLFRHYRDLVHVGEWDKKHFDECYVPAFLQDIRNSTNATPLLQALVRLSGEKKILLACFCPEELEYMCHRSIVAGILINMGAKVVCADEYSKYRLYQ